MPRLREGLMVHNGWWLQAVILATGILGQMVVARRRTWGFYAWIVCNLGLIYTSLNANPVPYGNIALYTFYTAMCVYSIVQWRRMDTQSAQTGYAPQGWVVRSLADFPPSPTQDPLRFKAGV